LGRGWETFPGVGNRCTHEKQGSWGKTGEAWRERGKTRRKSKKKPERKILRVFQVKLPRTGMDLHVKNRKVWKREKKKKKTKTDR